MTIIESVDSMSRDGPDTPIHVIQMPRAGNLVVSNFDIQNLQQIIKTNNVH